MFNCKHIAEISKITCMFKTTKVKENVLIRQLTSFLLCSTISSLAASARPLFRQTMWTTPPIRIKKQTNCKSSHISCNFSHSNYELQEELNKLNTDLCWRFPAPWLFQSHCLLLWSWRTSHSGSLPGLLEWSALLLLHNHSCQKQRLSHSLVSSQILKTDFSLTSRCSPLVLQYHIILSVLPDKTFIYFDLGCILTTAYIVKIILTKLRW